MQNLKNLIVSQKLTKGPFSTCICDRDLILTKENPHPHFRLQSREDRRTERKEEKGESGRQRPHFTCVFSIPVCRVYYYVMERFQSFWQETQHTIKRQSYPILLCSFYLLLTCVVSTNTADLHHHWFCLFCQQQPRVVWQTGWKTERASSCITVWEARNWTPDCSWCAGRLSAWQPPSSVCECMNELLKVAVKCKWNGNKYKCCKLYCVASVLVARCLSGSRHP